MPESVMSVAEEVSKSFGQHDGSPWVSKYENELVAAKEIVNIALSCRSEEEICQYFFKLQNMYFSNLS